MTSTGDDDGGGFRSSRGADQPDVADALEVTVVAAPTTSKPSLANPRRVRWVGRPAA